MREINKLVTLYLFNRRHFDGMLLKERATTETHPVADWLVNGKKLAAAAQRPLGEIGKRKSSREI